MCRARERGVGGFDIAHVGVNADIGAMVIEPRRAGLHGGWRRGDRIERLVFDRDVLGRVLRLRERLCHHHHDLLADVAHPVGRQQLLGRDAPLRSVAIA